MLIKDITAYIEYLKTKYNLCISVHIKDADRFIYFDNLSKYNTHTNPYCMNVKTKMHHKCMECQRKVYIKCENFKYFCGECHAGVCEYVASIKTAGKVIGFISVSGYKGKKNPPSDNEFFDIYLSDEAPDEELLTVIISPLSRMFELLFARDVFRPSDNFHKIKAYINEYHLNISLDDICHKFHFSKSYVSHLFKSHTGFTIKEYSNQLKINDAKELLVHSSLSVTDIAYSCGFNDLSYFISTFKRATGVTPLSYRKNLK